MIDLTNFARTLGARPVAVLGLARSGLATLRALHAAGIEAYGWDDSPIARNTTSVALRDFTQENMELYACLILSPGVPLDHPIVCAAIAGGVEVMGDMEVLHRSRHGVQVIGITGTNGKSTTTALTAHILDHCGIKVACGGNIGRPVLDLDKPPKSGVFVLEISSFQSDLCPSFRPDSIGITNITPDHLARHGTFAAYSAAKSRMMEGEKGLAVIGVDEAQSFAIAKTCRRTHVVLVSVLMQLPNGVYVTSNGQLYVNNREIVDLSLIPALRGRHNWQNAAIAASLALFSKNVPVADVVKALQSWGGLAHRQYPVRTLNGVLYINDSKATNPEAAAPALVCFDRIYWIVGGAAREVNLETMTPHLGHVCHAFLIGEAAPVLATWLNRYGVPYTSCGTMEGAVSAAHTMAQAAKEKGTVLLSPAYQSFDQFTSFEHRGDVFTSLVMNLASPPEMG